MDITIHDVAGMADKAETDAAGRALTNKCHPLFSKLLMQTLWKKREWISSPSFSVLCYSRRPERGHCKGTVARKEIFRTVRVQETNPVATAPGGESLYKIEYKNINFASPNF